MIGCFDFILHLCIYLNMIRCQLIIGGKKVGYFAMTKQQHHSISQPTDFILYFYLFI